MNHVIRAVFLLLLFLTSNAVVGASARPDTAGGSPGAIDMAVRSGEIRGTFDSCGSAGSSGVIVYAVGRSFSALLGPDGSFTLSYVPAGTYSLAFVRNNQVLVVVDGVGVSSNQATDVGPLNYCPDADGDGFDLTQDCNDNNPAVHPGAAETCNGLDNDCNGIVDDAPGGCVECTDADRDGFYAQDACEGPADCNDDDPSVSPAVQEVCFDGQDNNCDGVADENCGCPTGTEDCDGNGTCETDLSGDSANCGACGVQCPTGDVCNQGACVSSGPACTDQEFAILESCLASCGSDLNCASNCVGKVSGPCGQAVQQLSLCSLSSGCPIVTGGDLLTSCVYQSCSVEWDAAFGDTVPGCPQGKVDCNGQCVDLGSDPSHCGACNMQCPRDQVCDQGVCRPGGPIDNDLDGYFPPDDCNDSDPDVFPGAHEVCGDGIDNDCDGLVDDGCSNSCDGIPLIQSCTTGELGVCSAGEQTRSCVDGQVSEWGVCKSVAGPSAETCDGLDNDCDGSIDEGNPGGGASCDTGGLGICGTGQTVCSNAKLVCKATQQPAPEVCGDGLDNDCDGSVDEGCANTCDGIALEESCATGQLGVCDAGVRTRTCVDGQVSAWSTCQPLNRPAHEVCDNLDNDCDGQIDEGGVCEPTCNAGDRCDDGDPCTFDDVCSTTGVCQGKVVSCDDGNTCTQDFCDPAAGGVCQHVDAKEGSVCDGGFCSGGVCQGSTCQPGQDVCNGVCTDLTTDPANCGACGKACRQGDACKGGVCVAF